MDFDKAKQKENSNAMALCTDKMTQPFGIFNTL